MIAESSKCSEMRLLMAFVLISTSGCDPVTSPGLIVATQNAGTTPFLDLIEEAPHREACDDWYGNNLCTNDTESILAEAISAEKPGILMLQEVWDQRRCSAPERPEEVDEPPFVCSMSEGHQLLRVLPEGYEFACAEGARDALTCVAFDTSVFQAETADGIEAVCPERDCSEHMIVTRSDCEELDGQVAFLRGTLDQGPAVITVVHLFAGLVAGGSDCRAAQLRAGQEALAELPDDIPILIAGDFNFDPSITTTADAVALEQLIEALDLVRLPTDGTTHRIFEVTIDLVFSRGWPGADSARCETRYLDGDDEPPMLDHAYVGCR